MRRTVKRIALYTLVFLSISTIYKYLTDDFSVTRLVLAEPRSEREIRDDPDLLFPLLDQTYTYLGKGKQAYAFLSSDGKHVLKLFKPYFPSHQITVFGKSFSLRFSKIPCIQTLYAFFFPKEIQKHLEQDFVSYHNSFALLSTETGLEYLHLYRTDHPPISLHIVDKLGISHTINANTACFLIQKKMDMLYPTLASCLKTNDIVKAKELLDSFVALSLKFVQTGIVNPTTIEPNWGCLGSTSMLLDVGRVLTYQNIQGESPPSFDQVQHTTHHLKKWLSKHSPLLESYLETAIETQSRSCL